MITGIAHLAFRVSDLDRSLDFYCRQLGMREAFRLDREGHPSPWIVYLRMAPGQFIELFPHREGPIPPQDPTYAYQHLCLSVDDMRATLEQLKERGLEITGEPRQGRDHNWQYWIADPDGNRIELMQMSPDSPQAAADELARRA